MIKPVIDEKKSVDKLVIARQLAAEDWFCSAIYELVTRTTTLTAREAKKLRLGVAFRISRLREEWVGLKEKDNVDYANKVADFYRYNRYSGHPTQPGIPEGRISQLRLAIRHCFSPELANMGCPVDKSRRPILFWDSLDNDQCFLEEPERPLNLVVNSTVDQHCVDTPLKNRAHYHETVIFQVSLRLKI
jgi:hypothetical protein